MSPAPDDDRDRRIREDLDSILGDSRRILLRDVVLGVGALLGVAWLCVTIVFGDGVRFDDGHMEIFWRTNTSLGVEMDVALVAVLLFVLVGLALTRRREP